MSGAPSTRPKKTSVLWHVLSVQNSGTFCRSTKADGGCLLSIKTDTSQPDSESIEPLWVVSSFACARIECEQRETSNGGTNEGHNPIESDVDKYDEDQ